MSTDRFHATESSIVRLYFRNYVSNVLTDLSPSPYVVIRLRGGSQTIATPPVIRESVGVYYVDWAIPCKTNPNSPKFDQSFPGPGYYQDVWTSGSQTWAQDFYVERESFPNNLATINEPLQFTHELLTNRVEVGAKDFITWRITEVNGRLIPGESVFPEGELQIFYGDQVIKNYDKMIHKADREIYRYYIDTTSLSNGIYKLQARFFIPEGTTTTRAAVTTLKSLGSGFTPISNAILDITADGVQRLVSFPTTATQASIEGGTVSNPNALSFPVSANDVFMVNVDGTEKRIELVNTVTPRNVTDIVAELNGTLPSEWTALGVAAPIVTSSLVLTSVPAGLNNTTLTFEVDDVSYTVQFNNPLTLTDIVNQINAVYTPTGNIAINNNGIIAFAKLTGAQAITSIRIIGGTATTLLGFVENQYDSLPHSIAPVAATVQGGAIKLTGTTAGTLRVLSGKEGSVANGVLGFPTSGATAVGVSETPASVTGSGAVYPIQVINPSAATVRSTVTINDFKPASVSPYNTQLNTKNLDISVDGAPAVNVVFNDQLSPAAITSLYTYGSYNVNGKALIINGSTVTFSGTDPIPLTSIVSAINSAGILNVVADVFNGHLRIRATNTTTSISIDTTSTALSVLGFDSAAFLSSPEVFYQNDQVYLSGGNLVANPYVKPWTLSDIVQKINATYGSNIAAVDNQRLVITSPTVGSTSSLAISGTANTLLMLPSSSSGTSGQNYNLYLSYGVPNETIVFEDGIYTLQDFINAINLKASAARAEESSGQIKISSVATGPTALLQISGSAASALGLSPTIATGGSTTAPTIVGSAISPVTFASGGRAKLYVSWTNGSTVVANLIDLSSVTSLSGVASAINSVFSGYIQASVTTFNTLKLTAVGYGSSYTISVGSINDGSTANSVLGFSTMGASASGTDGTPYTLDQIVERINASFGGNEVADKVGNFLRLRSISSGASSYIQIGNGTTSNILNDWGIGNGIVYGTTTTQVAQVIVSPKLTLVIGE